MFHHKVLKFKIKIKIFPTLLKKKLWSNTCNSNNLKIRMTIDIYISSLLGSHIYLPILLDFLWCDTYEVTEIKWGPCGKMTCLKAFSQLGSLTHSPLVPVPGMKIYINLRQRKGHPSSYLHSIHNSWNYLPQGKLQEKYIKSSRSRSEKFGSNSSWSFNNKTSARENIPNLEAIVNKCHGALQVILTGSDIRNRIMSLVNCATTHVAGKVGWDSGFPKEEQP